MNLSELAEPWVPPKSLTLHGLVPQNDLTTFWLRDWVGWVSPKPVISHLKCGRSNSWQGWVERNEKPAGPCLVPGCPKLCSFPCCCVAWTSLVLVSTPTPAAHGAPQILPTGHRVRQGPSVGTPGQVPGGPALSLWGQLKCCPTRWSQAVPPPCSLAAPWLALVHKT